MTFTPLPAHVRTARLVATAVARRSGVAESLLDEVRLAVGEACSRAVEVHQEYCPAEPVRVALTGSRERFEVVVTNAAVHGRDMAPEGWPAAAAPAGQGPAERHGNGDGTGPGDGSAGPGDGSAGPAAGPGGWVQARTAVTHLPPSLPSELGLAVIAGLADDVQVSQNDSGLSIRMSWPSKAAK
jgi:histidine kinase-like protein